MKVGEVRDLLKERGAIITKSHLVLKSGRHASAYINKDALYPYTKDVRRLCLTIAQITRKLEIETVIAPAVAGVVLSQWTAYFLSKLTEKEVFAVFAEKTEDGKAFVIKRGYDKFVRGRKVLVVEDILTTGGSVKGVIDAVGEKLGVVTAVGAICNRGGVTAKDVNSPILFSLIDVKLDSWSEEECPLYTKGVPINIEVGKGREFLARKGQ